MYRALAERQQVLEEPGPTCAVPGLLVSSALEEVLPELGMGLEQVDERRSANAENPARLGRSHRRIPAPGVSGEQSLLAEDRARGQAGQDHSGGICAFRRDLEAALLDDEAVTGRVALPDDEVPGGELQCRGS